MASPYIIFWGSIKFSFYPVPKASNEAVDRQNLNRSDILDSVAAFNLSQVFNEELVSEKFNG